MVEDVEVGGAENVETQAATGEHHLQVLWDAGPRVAYPLTPIGGGRVGGIAPFAQQKAPRNTGPMYSNIMKRYANWNVCFSYGFDVEDGHTSKTCPAPWR